MPVGCVGSETKKGSMYLTDPDVPITTMSLTFAGTTALQKATTTPNAPQLRSKASQASA